MGYDCAIVEAEGRRTGKWDYVVEFGWPHRSNLGRLHPVVFLFGKDDDESEFVAIDRIPNGEGLEFGKDEFESAVERYGGIEKALLHEHEVDGYVVARMASYFLDVPDGRLRFEHSW